MTDDEETARRQVEADGLAEDELFDRIAYLEGLVNKGRRAIELEWGLTDTAKEMRRALGIPLDAPAD